MGRVDSQVVTIDTLGLRMQTEGSSAAFLVAGGFEGLDPGIASDAIESGVTDGWLAERAGIDGKPEFLMTSVE